MPMALHVFLHDAALPTCEQWQSGIAEEGFRLVLDKTLDVRQNTGFSPAVYGGRKSGFEFDLLPVTGVTSVGKGDWARIDGHDVCANFQCGGNVRESISIYIASAVLAKLANGVLYDPKADHFLTGSEAVAVVRRLIEATELD
jgi:hypothetical protein